MHTEIVKNRVAGTRITVWDVFYYLEKGRSQEDIAEILGLALEQVQAAVAYIEAHREEILTVHLQIEERNARGNPPEMQATLDASHARFLETVQRLREAKHQEVKGAGTAGRQERGKTPLEASKPVRE